MGRDQAGHFLDASDLQRGLITFDYQNWYLRHDATAFWTLLWDVDRCTGVRCELPPLSDLTQCTQCNGAFVLYFSSGKKDHSVYLVPTPPMLGNARLVYEGKEALLMSKPAFGNATFPPFCVRHSDWRLRLLDANTDQLPKGEAMPGR